MGDAKRKADYRNRAHVVAKGFYEGKLSQRDAARMREDRTARELALPVNMAELPSDEAEEEVSSSGLWLVLVASAIFTVALWWLWP